jgi:hypothetical protein
LILVALSDVVDMVQRSRTVEMEEPVISGLVNIRCGHAMQSRCRAMLITIRKVPLELESFFRVEDGSCSELLALRVESPYQSRHEEQLGMVTCKHD